MKSRHSGAVTSTSAACCTSSLTISVLPAFAASAKQVIPPWFGEAALREASDVSLSSILHWTAWLDTTASKSASLGAAVAVGPVTMLYPALQPERLAVVVDADFCGSQSRHAQAQMRLFFAVKCFEAVVVSLAGRRAACSHAAP